MKRRTQFIVLVLSLGILAAFVVSLAAVQRALAQDSGTNQQEDTAEAEVEVEVVKWAAPPGLVPQEAVEQALASAVSNSVLTQAEADQILADIETNAAAIEPAPWQEEVNIVPFEGGLEVLRPDVAILGPHGYIGALHQAVEEGILTQEEMQQILSIFSELAGEDVTVEFPEGEEGGMGFSFKLETADPEAIQQAFAAALDQAVTDGILTQEEADTILANAEKGDVFAPPHAIFAAPGPAGVAIEAWPLGWGMGNGSCLLEAMTAQVETAVAQDKMTQEEADSLLETLQGLLVLVNSDQ